MIHWDDHPPTDELPKLNIFRAPHAYTAKLVVLSRRGAGVFGHWNEGERRNLPCNHPWECYCDGNPVERWWRYYLGAWTGKVVVLVELSKDAFLAAQVEQLVKNRGTLRGLFLDLTREPRVKTGRVVATFREPAALPDDDRLGPEPDLQAALTRIWYGKR